MQSFMKASFMIGFAIAYLIAVLKVAFYAWATWYLQRPSSKSLFAAGQAEPAVLVS